MKLDELYPSRFLKSSDFTEGEVRVLTIRDVQREELGRGDDKETKPILSFREKDAKEMVLNKTNARTIGTLYGDDTDDWLGKKIALYVTDVESFGEMVAAIRVKTKTPGVPSPQPAANMDVDWGDLNDEPTPAPINPRNNPPLQAGGVMRKARQDVQNFKFEIHGKTWGRLIQEGLKIPEWEWTPESAGWRAQNILKAAGWKTYTDDKLTDALDVIAQHYAEKQPAAVAA